MTNKIEISYDTSEFEIFNMQNFDLKVRQLSAKFQRLHCQPLQYVVLGKVERTFKGCHWYDPDFTITLTQVRLSYPSYKIDGWKVVGTIDHVEGLVHGDNIPAHYRTSAPKCDHCHVERQRNKTVILQNEETAEYKQIGANCLSLYLGIDAALAALMSDEEKLKKALSDPDIDEDEEFFRRNGRAEMRLENYLAFVALSIRLNGWVSSKEAYGSYKVSSANRAFDLMRAANEDNATLPTTEDRQRAQSAVDWALTIADNEGDYLLNLRAIAQNGYCTDKSFGYAASMLAAYDKAGRAKVEASVSAHVGSVGSKIDITATCYYVSDGIVTSYGWMFVNLFKDATGNVYAWKTSTRAELGEYRVKATVKAHEEYRGTCQTVITRAKLEAK